MDVSVGAIHGRAGEAAGRRRRHARGLSGADLVDQLRHRRAKIRPPGAGRKCAFTTAVAGLCSAPFSRRNDRRHRPALGQFRRAAAIAAGAPPAASGAAGRRSTPRYSSCRSRGGASAESGTGEVSLCAGAGAPAPARCFPTRLTTALKRARTPARPRSRVWRRGSLDLEGAVPSGEASPATTGSPDRVMLLADRMMRRFFALVRDIKEDAERDELERRRPAQAGRDNDAFRAARGSRASSASTPMSSRATSGIEQRSERGRPAGGQPSRWPLRRSVQAR